MKSILIYTLSSLLLFACSKPNDVKKEDTNSTAIPVRIAPIDMTNRVTIIATSGLITTEKEARLSFKVGGLIDKILVQEGNHVRKGQLLASLNETEIAAQVQQVQLGVDKAQRDYQRTANLYKDSVATLEQYQNSQTGLEVARQNLQQVLFNRQYSSIYAPADGFIIKKLNNTGELAGPGVPVLIMSVLDGSSKWVLKAGISDSEWAKIETGNKALVTTDAFPSKNFNAVVNKKALAADPSSGSFEIELLVDFSGMRPAVGLFGKAVITPSEINKGYRIPYDALLEANGNKGFVFVTNDQKTAKRVDVIIASIENDRVLISEGLSGHSFVIISGSPYLTDGADINIIK